MHIFVCIISLVKVFIFLNLLITVILNSISDYTSSWISYESASIMCIFSWIIWSYLIVNVLILINEDIVYETFKDKVMIFF